MAYKASRKNSLTLDNSEISADRIQIYFSGSAHDDSIDNLSDAVRDLSELLQYKSCIQMEVCWLKNIITSIYTVGILYFCSA